MNNLATFAELLARDPEQPPELREVVSVLDLDDKKSLKTVCQMARVAGISTDKEFDAAVKGERHRRAVFAAIGCNPNDCSEFVEALAGDVFRMKVTFNGQLHRYDAELGRYADCLPDDWQRLVRLTRDKLGLKHLHREDCNDAAVHWYKKALAARPAMIAATIAHDPAIAFDWDGLVAASFETTGETSPALIVSVLQKFAHSVKRKLLALPVQHHLMAVLVGRQGGGKSTFLHTFLEPVRELSQATDFERLVDNREIDLFSFPVLLIDEMAHASKADIERVKNVVTSDTIARRPMRTNVTVQIRNSATLIGASNKLLSQLIRDETGLRRFVQLPFHPDADRDYLANVDWLAMWQSIDPNGPDPIVPFLAELGALQDASRTRSQVEEWLSTLDGVFGRRVEQVYGDRAIRKDELHDYFLEWCDGRRIAERFTMTAQSFANELHRLRMANPDAVPFEAKAGPKKAYNGWRWTGDVTAEAEMTPADKAKLTRFNNVVRMASK